MEDLMISRRTALLAALVFAAMPLCALADDDSPNIAADAKKVAVIPLGNKDGTDGAREKTASGLRKLLEKRGFRVLEGDSVKKAYEDSVGETPGAKDKLLTLRDKDLLKVGRALKVDYVIAGNLVWHTKSIYVFPSLRTKADCTADGMVVDVSKAEVIVEKHEVKRDSENKNTAAGVASVVFGLGYGVLSGGPKTPPQAVSGIKALYAALEEFLTDPKGPHKIDEGDSKKKK